MKSYLSKNSMTLSTTTHKIQVLHHLHPLSYSIKQTGNYFTPPPSSVPSPGASIQSLTNVLSILSPKYPSKLPIFLSIPLVTLLVQTPSCCLHLYDNLLTHFLASYLGLIYIAKLISYHSSAAVLHSSYVSPLSDFDNF